MPETLETVAARLRSVIPLIPNRNPRCPCGPGCSTPIACLIQIESARRRMEHNE